MLAVVSPLLTQDFNLVTIPIDSLGIIRKSDVSPHQLDLSAKIFGASATPTGCYKVILRVALQSESIRTCISNQIITRVVAAGTATLSEFVAQSVRGCLPRSLHEIIRTDLPCGFVYRSRIGRSLS